MFLPAEKFCNGQRLRNSAVSHYVGLVTIDYPSIIGPLATPASYIYTGAPLCLKREIPKVLLRRICTRNRSGNFCTK